MTSPETSVKNQPSRLNRIVAAFKLRWVRMACLLGILVFELGFIWFILHFGWLESINVWTQAGVVFVAFLPLLVAAFFLIRKRFSLTSAFVAVAMFALFMAFTMRPVYEARKARIPVKILQDSGARLSHQAYVYDVSKIQYNEWIEAPKSKLSDWVARLLGDDASIRPAEEIMQVHVQDVHQLKELDKVANQLPNLTAVSFDINISSADFKKCSSLFESETLTSLDISTFPKPACLTWGDVAWLEGNKCFEVASFLGVARAPEALMKIQESEIEILSLQIKPRQRVPIAWDEVFRSPMFRKLKILRLVGYEVTNDEAKKLAQLKNLKFLWICHHESVSDFSFLNEMPQLRGVVITSKSMTKEQLLKFPVPVGLERLALIIPKAISEQAIEKFKKMHGERCDLSIHSTY